MKSIFPKYIMLCKTECSDKEITERIENGIAHYENRFKIKDKSVSNPRFTILSGTGSRFYYNSFMPVITIDITDSDVLVTAQLHKSIKVFFLILILLSILFVAPAIFFADIMAVALVSLIILGFIAFAYVLATLGLKHSSKNVLKDFYEMINLEYPKTDINITRF